MNHPKRPRDPNQLAKSIIDIAEAGPRPYARRAGQGSGCGAANLETTYMLIVP
jgi:hypothetical protein